ncbi:V-type ATP synthase subunit I [Halobaculum sp. MBLA0147]|uniref:V-type ATP synthase subunit I n=1 Tax=Halobaculum sp. MBLA0147 TaxID=3079934 RepID=UPI0035252A67
MLRPEQMSKVSVTGSRGVMGDVIEAMHDLSTVHLTEYDGNWEGFDQGVSTEGAEEAADKLVTVRSLQSQLGVEESDAGPSRIVTDEALDEELEEVRTEANRLDDRREELKNELRRVDERIDGIEPFVELGIDVDLLSGYDSLQVAVGEGDEAAVEEAVVQSPALDEYQIFSGGDVLAVFARPSSSAEADALADVLVSAEFAAIEVPELDADENTAPEAYHKRLQADRQELESEIEAVEADLETLREEWAGFLLAAEEELAIRVGKAEAPLSFATTDNAFVAEGWIPTEEYTEFAGAISDAVGNGAEIEELQRASFGPDGEVVREDVPESVREAGRREPPETDTDETEQTAERQRAVADGGVTADTPVVMRDDDPPTVQNNADVASPFELLVRMIGKPNYTEYDPTVVLFLTFPVMFGFMIGDFAYGLIYTGIGAYVYRNFDSQTFKAFGGIAITAGLFTTAFGILYGEIFGLHLISTYFWEGLVGLKHAPIEKGLSPAGTYWANTWFVVTVLFGVLHLNVGYTLEFLENLQFHGVVEALEESGSWLLMLNGLWLFIFSDLGKATKPDMLFEVFSSGSVSAFELGFTGFPTVVGYVGVGMLAVGLVLLALADPAELVEFHVVLAHALSYLRIGAVLLAKAGMAFAVNLLFFGAYIDGKGEYHFMLQHDAAYVLETKEGATIMFEGLMHGGIALLLVGILVLIVGHLIVLALGVTSSGIQAARLEYFEFFEKFYEGDGVEYEPFGTDRQYTAEE